MGLISAAASAISGNLADQWLEVMEADNMTEQTIIAPGVLVNKGKGSNTKRNDNVISNGSKIHVYPNQMMILIENGKVVDYCGEEGLYTVDTTTAPSLFSGKLSASIKDTWERFKYGGVPSNAQKLYFLNLGEITGFKFGTANAINYFDTFYNAELSMRCHGQYSIKLTDPIKFFNSVAGTNIQKYTSESMNSIFLEEFVSGLSVAISQMSEKGERISFLKNKQDILGEYMRNSLAQKWGNERGFEVYRVTMDISYDKASQDLINLRNRGAMMSDPSIREGYVQSTIAEGINAAGHNTSGAGNAFTGVNLGMNAAGGFMNSASQTNAMQMQMQMQQQQMQQQQMQQAQAAQNSADSWTCACGKVNTGKFCAECGAKKPEAQGSWTCACGKVNTGKFCDECGAKRPENTKWTCSCGQVNEGKFCSGCGTKKPE